MKLGLFPVASMAAAVALAACNAEPASVSVATDHAELTAPSHEDLRPVEFCGDGVDQDHDGSDNACAEPAVPPTAPVIQTLVVDVKGLNEDFLVPPKVSFPRGKPLVRVVNDTPWDLWAGATVVDAMTSSNVRVVVPTTLVFDKVGGGARTHSTSIAWERRDDLYALQLGGRRSDGKLVEMTVMPDEGSSRFAVPIASGAMDDCVSRTRCTMGVRVLEMVLDPATRTVLESRIHRSSESDDVSFTWDALTKHVSLTINDVYQVKLTGSPDALSGTSEPSRDARFYARSFELELAVLGGRPLTTMNDGLSDFTCASRVDHNCEEP